MVTPFVGRGDVLRLLYVEAWMESGRRTLYNSLLFVAFAALAACARVLPRAAIGLLLADYEAGMLSARAVGRKYYPVILLPVAVEAIERYLAERRRLGIGGRHLFVDRRGDALKSPALYIPFQALAKRSGHSGGNIFARLLEFFDLQLAEERRDIAACVVLRRGRRGRLDDDVSTPDIEAAMADRERLARVLGRNHELGGPAGRWMGPRGREEAARTARLFLPPTRVLQLSPATATDPVCTRLLRLDWVDGKLKQRKKIVDDDLPHLFRLFEDGLINLTDLHHLLNCSHVRAGQIIRRHRASLQSPEERATRERNQNEWRIKAFELYRTRPRDELPGAFHKRIVVEAGYPFGRETLLGDMMRAGLMPAQVARRQKKSMSAKREKTEKPVLRSGERDVAGNDWKV